MNPEAATHEPAGGDGLLFLIAAAIVGVVTAEALFIAFSSWWLLAGVLAFAILAAAGVAGALVRMMDDDEAPGQPAPSEKPAAARPARRPYTAPAVRPLPPG